MNSNYINRIIDGDKRAFDDMYKALKPEFIRICRRRFSLGRSLSEDLYHDALAVLYNNIETGRLERDKLPDEKVGAYVGLIARNIQYNRNRKRQIPLVYNPWRLLNDSDDESSGKLGEEVPYDAETDDKLFILRTTVRDMPMPCAEILRLAVYEKKSNEEVASIMHYANSDSAKTQRSRCMQKLRDQVKKRFKECGYEQ